MNSPAPKITNVCQCLAGILGLCALIYSVRADDFYTLDGAAGGRRFDGLGAVSGGGATSVLLKDYPEPQRSQMLDLLFKPDFGAAMSALFVEIPGDGNSTQGAELSHMHSRTDENYQRGYEWWLMREAKARNAALTLDGVAWGCPGWVGNGEFWSQDMCDYYVKWIHGLKQVHGLDMDAIGCRNERGVNVEFVKRLRRTLDQDGLAGVKIHAFDNWGQSKWDWCAQLETDPELRHAVDVLGNHTIFEVPATAAVKEMSAKFGKPIWNTEEHVYRAGFDCELSLVQTFNRNFISNGVTKVVCWYLVSAFYPVEPYHDVTVMVADAPWSGHYTVNPALWAYAHYGQFCQPGWRYLDGGCANLGGGGSFVTLASGANYSIIAETKGAKSSQLLDFKITGGLARGSLCVWRSNAREQFVQQPGLHPERGEFSVVLEPDSIYSISTTTGQQKGGFEAVPAAAPFPFPYRETFDEYNPPSWWGYEPLYTADICGGFEVAERPDGQGQCLRQVVGQKAQNWGPEWMPYTIIGDRHWTNYEVSADLYLDGGGWAGVLGRVSGTGNGWGCNPKGYYLRLYDDGAVALYVANNATNGAPGKLLARAQLADFSAKEWHNLKLAMAGPRLTASVNGVEVLSTNDATYVQGMAGLVTGGENDARNTACFDNLAINAVGAGKPEASGLAGMVTPMYQPAGTARVPGTKAPGPLGHPAAATGENAAAAAIPSRPAELAEKYLNTFTSGSMAAKQSWDLAAASINAGDFPGALATLEDLRKQPGLSPGQAAAVDEVMAAIKNATAAKPAP